MLHSCLIISVFHSLADKESDRISLCINSRGFDNNERGFDHSQVD